MKIDIHLVFLISVASFCSTTFASDSPISLSASTNNDVFTNTLEGCVTNGIWAIISPDDPLEPIVIGIGGIETQPRYRWVRPTNEVPCKIWLYNQGTNYLAPTNPAILSAFHLPFRWDRDAFPHKRTRRSPNMFFNDAFFCFMDLKKYYDISKGGNFTLKVSPMLYDAKQETNVLHLVELPPATYTFYIPSNTVSKP